MFDNFLKKLRCEHDYKFIQYSSTFLPSMKIMVEMYCPKCDKEIRINEDKYDKEEIIKEIKKDYKG